MKTKMLTRMQQLLPSLCLSAAVLVAGISPVSGWAAAPVARIAADISGSERTFLPGTLHPLARTQFDAGRLPASTQIQGISLYFNRSAAQEADLKKLIAAQQNPSSPQFHQWLSPDQFAARFGMAASDLEKVQSWLEQQGFSIDSVARSRNAIHFSGNAGQVEQSFSTEMHSYLVNGVKHFAPSTALSVPARLGPVVQSVRNLDDFRPRAKVHLDRKARPKPAYTQEGNYGIFFAPGDIDLQYDITKEYNAGYTGSGQSIVVIGQSEISLSDIENFQSAAGLPVKDPTLILVPGTGSMSYSTGDEAESDLDLEWSGAIAKGATITLVYTGGNQNYGAFDSLQYAIDQKIGNIISSSYGDCETDLGGQTLESSLEQAASQGQTVMSAAGDDGSTDCAEDTNLTTTQQQALAVDYPASSPYVTGVGGTEISQANAEYMTVPSSYWEGAGSSDVVTSLLQVVPEQAWNEDATCLSYYSGTGTPICSGGGGASALFDKPSWQAGVPGIPGDGKRDVPDLSLNAAIYNPGYVFCSSDQTAWDTADGQSGSCTSGFENSANGYLFLTAAGGTSFATPIFAGMVAIINQQQGYTTGQGLINKTLYTLASDATTYASAFRDITTGNNDCDSGSSFCSGTIGFAAGTGYDQATGLGTVDLYNLASAWPANAGVSLIATTTTVAASNAAPALNASDTFTITVAPVSGTATPTGTVTITVDSGTPITGNALTANGTFTYTTSFSTVGTHEVLATYSGDSTYASSSGSVTVTVPTISSGNGSFSMSSTNVTVADGSSASSTITIKPAGGYLGTVDLNFDTSNDNALENLCYEFTNTTNSGEGTVAVTGTASVTTQLSLDTNAADCASDAVMRKNGKHSFRTLHSSRAANNAPVNNGPRPLPATMALAGLMLAGYLGRRSRKLRSLAGVLVLAAIGLGVSACGSSSVTTTISNPPTGTYTITVTGQDSNTASINATTSFTLTIQ